MAVYIDYLNYKTLYQAEKVRADLLQNDLNIADDDFNKADEECGRIVEKLNIKIALLKQKLRMKEVN